MIQLAETSEELDEQRQYNKSNQRERDNRWWYSFPHLVDAFHDEGVCVDVDHPLVLRQSPDAQRCVPFIFLLRERERREDQACRRRIA